jgi:TonB family protein
MQSRRFLLFAPVFLAISLLGSAQEIISVDKLILSQHIDHSVAPVYPPIAKAAQVTGTVNLTVQIGMTGKVESIKVVSGPLMLQQAAIDAVKQWTYRPFVKDEKPVVVSGTVSIEFNAFTGMVSFESSLAENGPTRGEKKILDRYLKLSELCSKAMPARTDSPITMTVCKRAAEAADEFAPNVRFVEKRHAFVSAAWAFFFGGDLNAALTYADKSVDIVKAGHDDNSGCEAAYGIRGIVEGKLGDLTAADQDMAVSEDYGRKEITWAEQVGFESSDSYKRALVQGLRFHARVLQGLNRPEEAQKKLDEAAKYN